MQTYHNKTVQQTAELLGTDIKTGLTHDEVKKRLHHYGKNELIEKKKKNIFIKFLEQFNDFMIIILLSAAAVSFITSIMQGDADITEPGNNSCNRHIKRIARSYSRKACRKKS